MTKNALAMLGDILRSENIGDEDFQRTIGQNAYDQFQLENRVPALFALNNLIDNKSILYRFFMLCEKFDKENLLKLFGDKIFCYLLENDFVEICDDNIVKPNVSLACYDLKLENSVEVVYVFSDVKRINNNVNLVDDYVMSIGGASKSLAKAIIKNPNFRHYFVDAKSESKVCGENFKDRPIAADIGCGCGVQALILAKLGYETYATDISDRALLYAKVNSQVNNVKINFLKGSFLDPLEKIGLKFDLIISNPPFVITPSELREEHNYVYRDGGMEGDYLLEYFMANLPKFLKEKGVAIFLGNFENTDNFWVEKLDKYLPDNSDVWILKRQDLNCEQYIKMWMDDSLNYFLCPDEYEKNYAIWLRDFMFRKVISVSFAYFILQKNSDAVSKKWVKAEDASSYLNQPDGESILKTLVNKENVKKCSDDLSLLFAEKYVMSSDVTQERHYIPGVEDPRLIYMVQGGNLGRKKEITSLQAGFLGACDGTLTAKQICDALTCILNSQNSEFEKIDYDSVASEMEFFIKESIIEGFLDFT